MKMRIPIHIHIMTESEKSPADDPVEHVRWAQEASDQTVTCNQAPRG